MYDAHCVLCLTCIGHERANERYRSTAAKDLLLPNSVSQKDENRLPQG